MMSTLPKARIASSSRLARIALQTFIELLHGRAGDYRAWIVCIRMPALSITDCVLAG